MCGTGLYDVQTVVRPEPELADLVPTYLERRRKDIVALEDAILLGDYPTICLLGHSMKGSGGGYGFDGISEIGMRLERAGADRDYRPTRLAIDDLKCYMRNVEVRYD
jgi:hypothetical protein